MITTKNIILFVYTLVVTFYLLPDAYNQRIEFLTKSRIEKESFNNKSDYKEYSTDIILNSDIGIRAISESLSEIKENLDNTGFYMKRLESVKFRIYEDNFKSESTLAKCYPDLNIIVIDGKSLNWISKGLIYHELGHCVFGLDHDDEFHNIMNTTMDSSDTFEQNWEYQKEVYWNKVYEKSSKRIREIIMLWLCDKAGHNTKLIIFLNLIFVTIAWIYFIKLFWTRKNKVKKT